jgi:AraC-like DNA-binding protein
LVCLWAQKIGPGAGPYPQRVLPDGCIDLVWIGDAEPVVAGPATRALTARLPAGSLVLGARFRPGHAPGFLRVPASAFLDHDTPLGDVWGCAAGDLTARIADARAAEAKLAILERALAERADDRPPADDLVAEAVRWLADRPAGRIGQLARTLGVGPRGLHRRFRNAVGYGPKTLQRILRLQRALALAGRRRPYRLATLALEAGYADQAHMTREMVELSGAPPTELLARSGTTLGLSDLFNTGAVPSA